ncbi:MAG: AAA family ATPase, partial [Deltaproteobacteria bacterium]|nr:AAA family ATPase [Deltaproteobacteria bacterium]
MKLTKLEITGFKSFKDRTTVNFAEGISAIVGPNGCGKSNIVDAIRWVMGEQRVTVLRGKKMDDVVFNGSNDASAVGMAEVSLTLNNNGRKFPGKYSEFSEMKIARRIFRDGETEYSINKSPCRLLDIREFFMDAGVGAKTYSIVEQERISRLVEGKPEDRRHFIEEAAGIAKFKNRKEASLRKIESTKQNITRLNDIISEVKTQLAATSRQAKRAEKYKELKKDIRDARLNLALQSLATLRTSRSAMEEARTATDNRVIAAESNLRGQEAAVEALKAELLERDGAVSRLQERYYGLKNDINMAVQEISFSQGKIEELTARRRRDLADIEDLRKRRDSAAGEIEALAVTVRETESAIVEMTSLIDEQERNAESLKDEEMAAREELETAKGRQFDCLTEVSRIRNLLASLSKGIDDIKNKINREERDMEEQESRLSALDKELRSARTALAEDR